MVSVSLRQRHHKKSKQDRTPSSFVESVSDKEITDATHYYPLDMIAISFLSLGVYMSSLYPSIAGGDSGELVAESCHLGVSHPPGYPLFNMLVYIVTQLPFPKSAAWKANMFAAGRSFIQMNAIDGKTIIACDTGCVLFIYLSVMLWTQRNGHSSRPGAIAAAVS